MEQSNPNAFRKKVMIGNFFSFVLFSIVFALSLMTVLGYKLNFKKATFEPTSIVRLNLIPSGADVYSNRQKLDWWENTRLDVAEGKYRISVSKAGYLTWDKLINVKPRKVYWLTSRLIPEVKQYEVVKTYPTLKSAFSIGDRKHMVQEIDKNMFEIVKYDNPAPVYRAINLADYVSNADQSDFKFQEYDPKNELMVFRDKLSQDRFIIINTEDRYSTIDSLKKYPESLFTNLKLIDRNQALALSAGALYLIEPQTDKPPKMIAEDVVKFQLFGDDMLALVSTAKQEGIEAGPNDATKPYKISITSLDNKPTNQIVIDYIANPELFSAVRRSDDFDYLAYVHGSNIKVVKGKFSSLKQLKENADDIGLSAYERFAKSNPGIKVVLDKEITTPITGLSIGQSRFIVADFGPSTIELELEDKLIKSMNLIGIGASVLPQVTVNPDKTIVQSSVNPTLIYDLEFEEESRILANFISGSRSGSEPSRLLNWFDDTTIWENIGGVIRLKDYDGQNQRKLIPALSSFDIDVTLNNKYVYYYKLSADGQSVDLCRLSLIN